MKILQVTHRYPPQVGGVETHVKEISERLVDRGHEVTVFSADAGMDGERREVRGGVRVRRFRAFAPGDSYYVAPGIATELRRGDGDIVNAHNYHALASLAAAVGVGMSPMAFTTHYHGGSASPGRDTLLSLYRPLGRWAIDRADVVIAVSEWERELLRTDFSVAATVVRNGVDVDRFATARPMTRRRPYLLCIGRLEAYKGMQHVVRALPSMPEYDLLIAGRGPYRTELEGIVREKEVGDRVEFLGYVPDDRLPGLYAGAAVHANLSEFEAYGLTVGESLASGTPCVVRESAALSDWVTRGDVVGVVGLDVDTVVRAIETASGLESPSERLASWEDVVDEYVSLYDSVLASR